MKLKEFVNNQSIEPENYDFLNEIEERAEKFCGIIDAPRTRKDYIKNLCKKLNVNSSIELQDKIKNLASDVRNTEDQIKKILLYKTFPIPFDCDSCDGTCDLTNSIYEALWGWYYGKKENGKNVGRNPSVELLELNTKWNCFGFGSDTMNSFWNVFNFTIKKVYPKLFVDYKYPRASWLDPNKMLLSFDNFRDSVKNKGIYKLLCELSYLSHTIGNFTIIPHKTEPSTCFQQIKNSRFSDFQDKALQYLKEHQCFKDIFDEYVSKFYLHYYLPNNEIEIYSDLLMKADTEEYREALAKYVEFVKCRVLPRGREMIKKIK